MAVCVDTLEATLQSFDYKLDSILYQLEHKFSKVDSSYDENECQTLLSCVQIITIFKEIQNDLQEIKNKYKELKQLKQKTNEDLINKCKQMEERVKEIQQKFSIN